MKWLALLVLMATPLPTLSWADTIYVSSSAAPSAAPSATTSVYRSPTGTGVQCWVSFVSSETEARGHAGWWYLTPHQTGANRVIRWTNTQTDASLVIYITPNKSEAHCETK